MDGDVKPKAAKVAKEEAAFRVRGAERFEVSATADRDKLAPQRKMTGFLRRQSVGRYGQRAYANRLKTVPEKRSTAAAVRRPSGRRYSHQQARD